MSIVKTKAKYTPEQELQMQMEYNACETDEERDECVQELADRYDKNKRMIIAKLSRMKVYQPKTRVSKVTGGKPETKEALVARLEKLHKVQPGDLASVTKASKLAILILLGED